MVERENRKMEKRKKFEIGRRQKEEMRDPLGRKRGNGEERKERKRKRHTGIERERT